MFRNLMCVAVLLAASVGLVLAEPVRCRITSIENGKINVLVGAKKDVKGEPKTYDLAKDVKVKKAESKDKIEALADGLNAKELKNIDATKGVGAQIEVTGNTVTEITIIQKKKKE